MQGHAGSCTVMHGSDNSIDHWWQVDLGAAQKVAGVVVYHRSDQGAATNAGALVVVKSLNYFDDSDIFWGAVHICGTLIAKTAADKPSVEAVGCGGERGRYVAIYHEGGQVSLCEVRVFAPLPCEDDNVALVESLSSVVHNVSGCAAVSEHCLEPVIHANCPRTCGLCEAAPATEIVLQLPLECGDEVCVGRHRWPGSAGTLIESTLLHNDAATGHDFVWAAMESGGQATLLYGVEPAMGGAASCPPNSELIGIAGGGRWIIGDPAGHQTLPGRWTSAPGCECLPDYFMLERGAPDDDLLCVPLLEKFVRQLEPSSAAQLAPDGQVVVPLWTTRMRSHPEGGVEVLGPGGRWGPLCAHLWWDNQHGAAAICRMQGYTMGGQYTRYYSESESEQEAQIGYRKCTTGQETSIMECPVPYQQSSVSAAALLNCHGFNAGVVCTGKREPSTSESHPLWTMATPLCEWAGVGCDADPARSTDPSAYALTSLRLPRRGLQGTLQGLEGLSRLRVLDLSGNALYGTLLPLRELHLLTDLRLSKNGGIGVGVGFSGGLDALRSLGELRVLMLEANSFSGSLEPLGMLHKLRRLSLRDNHLTGGVEALGCIGAAQQKAASLTSRAAASSCAGFDRAFCSLQCADFGMASHTQACLGGRCPLSQVLHGRCMEEWGVGPGAAMPRCVDVRAAPLYANPLDGRRSHHGQIQGSVRSREGPSVEGLVRELQPYPSSTLGGVQCWRGAGLSPQPVNASVTPMESRDYLELDLGREQLVLGAALQGCRTLNEAVSSFHLAHSLDGERWTLLPEVQNGTRVGEETPYTGNEENVAGSEAEGEWTDAVVETRLPGGPVLARHVRLLPASWFRLPSMRAALLVCEVAEGDWAAQQGLAHVDLRRNRLTGSLDALAPLAPHHMYTSGNALE
eukprot:SAG11_NODE_1750_length_4320_cov_2.050462_1_plen_912_part_00